MGNKVVSDPTYLSANITSCDATSEKTTFLSPFSPLGQWVPHAF